MLARKALIVSTDSTAVNFCSATLADMGHTEVRRISTGMQALAVAAVESFDLALISDVLSDMTGIEAFERLKVNEPNMVGILLSSHLDVAMAVKAANCGFSGIVEQPFDSRVLRKLIDQAFQQLTVREENTRLHTLVPLYRLGERFLQSSSIHQVLDELVDAVCREIHVPSASVMIPEDEGGRLTIAASRGLDREVVEGIDLRPGEKIAGWVFENGEPVILNRETQHTTPFSSHLTRKEIAAAISFPLKGREKTIGVLNISQTRPDVEYSQSDLELLAIICRQAVVAIENLTFIKEREEHARIKALLEQYVSPEVAGLLVRSNQDLLDVGDIRDLTVLFADIRHFTLLVQHLSLEELRAFLNCFFDFFTREVFANKGTLDKFMGDAALVIFGAPLVIERPSVAAVKTAIKILASFERLKQEWTVKSDLFKQVGLGIGISRGRMFLGNVGSAKRLDYTVIGTEVNIAQRLASDTESGKILITGQVRDDIDGLFAFRHEQSRVLRGMEKEISLFSVIPNGVP
ncbi:MAG: GAF domain-containing protein [Desulfobulbaceae bacterium]|nr:MAG: GAF domain-containing protein [Desulfobulbaceae bacterium]